MIFPLQLRQGQRNRQWSLPLCYPFSCHPTKKFNKLALLSPCDSWHSLTGTQIKSDVKLKCIHMYSRVNNYNITLNLDFGACAQPFLLMIATSWSLSHDYYRNKHDTPNIIQQSRFEKNGTGKSTRKLIITKSWIPLWKVESTGLKTMISMFCVVCC